jgi:hypothetical protein
VVLLKSLIAIVLTGFTGYTTFLEKESEAYEITILSACVFPTLITFEPISTFL